MCFLSKSRCFLHFFPIASNASLLRSSGRVQQALFTVEKGTDEELQPVHEMRTCFSGGKRSQMMPKKKKMMMRMKTEDAHGQHGWNQEPFLAGHGFCSWNSCKRSNRFF